MAIGSQAAKADIMSGLTGLTHDVFVGRVANLVKRVSPTAMQFQDASPGDNYKLEGQYLKGAVDLNFVNGAMATTGKLPDHVPMDAVQWRLQPTRRYRRVVVDNLVEKQAAGAGAFEDLSDRIFDQLWDSWASMEIRHAIGFNNGYIAVVASRTSSTVVVLKDGYGHVGTNPLLHLSNGTVIAWLDASVSFTVAGAAIITVTAASTNTITVGSATTWEPSATTAAGDIIVMATTNGITIDYFDTENNVAPNGLGTILDPDAGSTTVFNVSQTTYPRWKPFRAASATFDYLEVTEHWLQLGQKRGFPVTGATDVAIAHPSQIAQLSRSLMGLQMQVNTGGQLKGGYTGGLVIAGMEIVPDGFTFHDVFVTLNKDHLFRINLSGDADMWGEDGSQWSRTQDFDAKEAYAVDYMNYMCNHRGANGALTAISLSNITASAYDPVPNY